MGLHSTSPNFPEAREPREENPLQGKQREGRHHRRSPRATGDSAIGPQDRGSQQKVVAADRPLDGVLQEIVQHARLATSATGAFIGLVRANKIVCQALSGSNTSEFVAYLNRDGRMVDSCLRTSSLQRCRDSEASEELDGRACRYLGARSVVLVPIPDETTEEKLGIFGVLSPQVDAFSNATIAALQSLSRRIADAIEQVDQCTPVPSGDAAAQIRPNPGNVLPTRARLLRALQRPVAVSRRSSVCVLGILAVVLLGGWTLTRAINQRAMHASAKTSAPVSQAASLGSAAVTAQSASSSPASPLSSNAGANPGQSPAVAAAVKPVREPPPAHKAIKKIPARSELHLPDLEIENALDDASPGSLVSESVDASKTDETSTGAAPRPEAADNKPASTNADSTPASPVVVPEKTALDHVAARVEPHYLALLNAQPVQGTAIVDVVVGSNGRLEVVRPVSGDPRLLVSAARAVRKWRFTPLVRNGQSVSFESHITFHFALP
jgi:TonB family protein